MDCEETAGGLSIIKELKCELVMNSKIVQQKTALWDNKLDIDEVIAANLLLRKEMQTKIVNEKNLEKTAECEKGTLQKKISELHSKHKDYESQIAALQSEIVNVDKSLEDFKIGIKNKNATTKNRNTIKALKALTGTLFEYKSSNVTGVISGEKTFKAFQFQKKKKIKDISNHLWEQMNNVCGVSWSDILDMEQ